MNIDQLTDQQRAIVEHQGGPALVFAVAGSGKTTCMVHRIKRLIEQGHARPGQILATSFNNSAARDIQKQLNEIGVAGGVDCCTLHALGLRIIRAAVQQNYLDRSWSGRGSVVDGGGQLVQQTLTRISIAEGTDISDLPIDWEELGNQISIWKGALHYADLEGANLPGAAQELAAQAEHENEMYLRAYRIHEELRLKQRIITFSDMLMMGWELLMHHPDLLKSMQSRYRYVMVDEFQDVNFAQYQLVDLIARPHKNYMAIGDDDQCIYAWRGADPAYILGFEKAYSAAVYTISDNFRSSAQQVFLANKIIERNKQRYRKRLSLTRGFDGETAILHLRDELAVARDIADRIGKLMQDGQLAASFVILLRLYSQSAFLETVFIERGLHYHIDGAEPFYRRRELITLFQYLSFAEYEADILDNGFPDDPQRIKKYLDMFEAIINKPRRYLARTFVKEIRMRAEIEKRSVLEILLANRSELRRGSLKKMEAFISTINNLIPRLKRPAHRGLTWLVGEIEYENWLLTISGVHEIGLTRIQNVRALIEFSRTKGSIVEFLDYIREISINRPKGKSDQTVTLMSIHRSKGLEWDTVFVPGCNEGIIPCAGSVDAAPSSIEADVEAERRLFYVAITRAKRSLFIHASGPPDTLSSLIKESEARRLLADVEVMKGFFAGKPVLRSKTVLRLCELMSEYHLERYVNRWNKEEVEQGAYLQKMIRRLIKKVERSRERVEAYEKEREKCNAFVQAYEERIAHRKQKSSETELAIRKVKGGQTGASIGDQLGFDPLKRGGVRVMNGSGIIGMVDFELLEGLDEDLLEWEDCVGTVSGIDKNGWISARFLRVRFNLRHPAFALPARRLPKKPPAEELALVQPEIRNGLEMLAKIFG